MQAPQKTPLKETPREDRERALNEARNSMFERFFRLSRELEEVERNIKQIDSQLLVMQGLELPDSNASE